MDTFHSREDVLGVRIVCPLDLQLVGKDVEQHFRIAVRIHVAHVFPEEIGEERVRVRQVAVMGEHDAVG